MRVLENVNILTMKMKIIFDRGYQIPGGTPEKIWTEEEQAIRVADLTKRLDPFIDRIVSAGAEIHVRPDGTEYILGGSDPKLAADILEAMDEAVGKR